MKFHASVTKVLKLKVRNFLGLVLTFVEVTGEKLVGAGGLFAPSLPSPPLILNRVKALKYFSKVKNIIIHKANKGKVVMILNKCPHLSAIEEILHDIAKISKFAIPAGD